MDLTTPVLADGAPLSGPCSGSGSGSGSRSRSSPGARKGAGSSPAATRALGDYGERLAARYLLAQGVQILDRNWRCVRGELDIVAREGADLVVCEVKTRSGEGFGAPFEAVTWRKQRRLRQLGGLWRDEHPDQSAGPLRIDVVSILCLPGRPARLEHLRGVC
ncbi:MAG TPA: YraN family protein [Humibacillus xanthopallidus]|nr:YraN family protein [Humibacillus xanthopallidus]